MGGASATGRGLSPFPGLPLRSVLLATYMVFRENRSEEELDDLDIELGFKEDVEDDSEGWENNDAGKFDRLRVAAWGEAVQVA